MGRVQQDDVLEINGYFVDKVKTAGCLPTVAPEGVLKRKILRYRGQDIDVATGVLFAELTLKLNTYAGYLAGAKTLGFTSIEVLSNLRVMTPKEKSKAIRYAKEKYRSKFMVK